MDFLEKRSIPLSLSERVVKQSFAELSKGTYHLSGVESIDHSLTVLAKREIYLKFVKLFENTALEHESHKLRLFEALSFLAS